MPIQKVTTKVLEENSVTWTKLSTQTQNKITTNVDITGGTIQGLSSPIPVSSGGTGGATTEAARIALGVVIGTDVQQYDDDLYTISTLDKALGNFIVSDGTQWAVQTPSQVRSTIDAQPLHWGLTQISTKSDSSTDGDILVFKNGTWTNEKNATFRATIGCTYGVDIHAFSSHIDKIDTLPKLNNGFIVADGTTWTTSIGSDARSRLGLVIGSDVQAYSTHLDVLSTNAGDGQFVVGNGTTWTTEGGATARTSLGLGDAATKNMSGTGNSGVAWGNHTHPSTIFWDNYVNSSGTAINGTVSFNGHYISNVSLSSIGELVFSSASLKPSNTTGYVELNSTGSDPGLNFTENGINRGLIRGHNDGGTRTIEIFTSSGDIAFQGRDNSGVRLYHNGIKKFETLGDGVDIVGDMEADTVTVNGSTIIESDAKIDWNKIKNKPTGQVEDIKFENYDISGWKQNTTLSITPSSILGVTNTTGWTFKCSAALRGSYLWKKSYGGAATSITVSTTRNSNNAWTINFSESGNYRMYSQSAVSVSVIGWKM